MEFNFVIVTLLLAQLAALVSSASLILSNRDKYQVHHHPMMRELMPEGMKLAHKHCQRQFAHEPWNCPLKDFLAKQQNSLMDRETAFVQSLTVAAIAYTVAKNCSKEKSPFCVCAFKETNDLEDIYDCFLKIRNAENELTHIMNQLSGRDAKYDPQGVMLVQNGRAGLFAVMNYVQKSCRCYGFRDQFLIPAYFLFPETVMNAKNNKACRCQDFHFDKIASDIKTMYMYAEPLDASNHMNMDHFVPTEREMVYLDESPDHCESVRGRRCATSHSTEEERAGCRDLCADCGLRMKWMELETTRSCNCEFHWSPPSVTCDVCEETVKEFFCA